MRGRGLFVVRVRGHSMEPTYRDGDRILARRGGRLAVGMVAVIRHAHTDLGTLIKRVAAVPGDPVPRLLDLSEDRVPEGKIVLLGDNPDVSFDSRTAGYFAVEDVLGRVLFASRRAARRL